MVGLGADAAYSLGYLRHILSQSPFTKFLKSPQFWHLEIGILYLASIIEENLDFVRVVGVNHRSYCTQEMRPLVDYSIYWSVTSSARHICLWAWSLAAATGG